MINPFDIIANIASGKAGKKMDDVVSQMTKMKNYSKEETKNLKKAVEYTAKIASNKSKIRSIDRKVRMGLLPKGSERRKQANIIRGYMGYQNTRMQRSLSSGKLSQHSKDINNYMATLKGKPGRAATQGSNMGSKAGNAMSNVAELFPGSKLQQFSQGLSMATRSMGGYGAAIFITIEVFKALSKVVKGITRMFKKSMEAADGFNRVIRKTKIASGGQANSERDLMYKKSQGAKGQLFLSDTEYVGVKNNLARLDLDFKDTLNSLQKLSFHTGQSVGDLSEQLHDAIMYGGDALYKSMMMNQRLMQRVMSVIPEGTKMSRDAVMEVIKDQKLLNSILKDTPKTIDEMMSRISEYKDLMTMTLVGRIDDPNSLYSVYRDTFKSIADWLMSHKKQIADVVRVATAFFKQLIGAVRDLGQILGGYLDRQFKKVGAGTDEFGMKLLAIEMRFVILRAKIVRFVKEAIPAIIDMAKAFYRGTKPLRVMLGLLGDFGKFILSLIGDNGDYRDGLNKVAYALGLVASGFVGFKIATTVLKTTFAVIRGGANILRRVWNIGKKVFSIFKSIGSATKRMFSIKTGGGLLSKVFGLGSKGLGVGLRQIMKKIPVIGLFFAASEAYRRFKAGDNVGGGLAIAEGIASLIPGYGTAAAVGIAGINVARDMNTDADNIWTGSGLYDSKKTSKQSNPTKESHKTKSPQASVPVNKNNFKSDISIVFDGSMNKDDANDFSQKVRKVVEEENRKATDKLRFRSGLVINNQSKVYG